MRTAFCILGAAAVFMVARPPASAQTTSGTTHEIEIGQFIQGAQAESMAFYPSSLRVRSGDVLHYKNEFGSIPESGIHGVLALPPGEEPLEWEQQNARNLDGEWAFFQTDEDDDAGDSPSALKGNWKVIFPSDLSCGTAENPCITGTSPASRSPFNSGVSDPLDFHLKVEAEPGTRIWLLCPIHPKMKMKVDVVSDGEPITTPEEIESKNEAKLLRETEKAQRLDRIFSARRTSSLRKDGTRLWDAWAGVERGTVSLFKMYPEKLSIKEGDSVKWHFEALRFEIHSVSFPLAAALDVNNAPWITLACDLDTDQGAAPDLEPQGGLCPAPPSDVWELDLHPRFYFPEGNGRLEGDEYESSGMRGPIAGTPHKPFTMRFPQSSGLTVWDYACQLHPTMRGAVRVL
ncbi:MAG: hypothetical protein ACR2L3_00150 [Actinomycetota bacterium]